MELWKYRKSVNYGKFINFMEWNGHLKFAEKDLPKQEMNIELCNGI